MSVRVVADGVVFSRKMDWSNSDDSIVLCTDAFLKRGADQSDAST